jgi:glutaredoxin
MEPFIEPESDKFTIYTKSGCPNCVKAKALLKDKSLSFLIVDCDEYILENKAEFLKFIEKIALTKWKIFPIIFDDTNKLVGGFEELKEHLDKKIDFTDFNF